MGRTSLHSAPLMGVISRVKEGIVPLFGISPPPSARISTLSGMMVEIRSPYQITFALGTTTHTTGFRRNCHILSKGEAYEQPGNR
jgi:hypothetical protein